MSYIGTQPVPQSLESRQEFTASASQTTFATSGYTVGYVDLYLNGVKLSTSDFTATNGSDIVLGSGAAAGDVLAVVMKNDHSDLVALPITDSAGNNVLSESGGVVTLTADTAVIEGSSSGDLVRITQTGTGNALVVEDSSNPDSTPFVVDASGNLLVGTTVSRNAKLNIKQTIAEAILDINHTNSGTQYFQYFVYDGSVIGTILGNNTSTSYNTSSDYRLKENITEITDGISRVKQLNPSRFNFISDPENTVDGFIAHEVQDIVPESVSGEKDAVNEDGSINPQGIDQSKLVPLLTAALQESIALIESQQSQIDALTARIEALETPAE